MQKRLEEDPDEIPAHALGQMLATIARVREKDAEQTPELSEAADPMEALDGLPLERQRQLLTHEIQRLSAQLADYKRRLEDLDGPRSSEAPDQPQ